MGFMAPTHSLFVAQLIRPATLICSAQKIVNQVMSMLSWTKHIAWQGVHCMSHKGTRPSSSNETFPSKDECAACCRRYTHPEGKAGFATAQIGRAFRHAAYEHAGIALPANEGAAGRTAGHILYIQDFFGGSDVGAILQDYRI